MATPDSFHHFFPPVDDLHHHQACDHESRLAAGAVDSTSKTLMLRFFSFEKVQYIQTRFIMMVLYTSLRHHMTLLLTKKKKIYIRCII